VIRPDVGRRAPEEEFPDLPVEQCLADIAANDGPIAIEDGNSLIAPFMIAVAQEEFAYLGFLDDGHRIKSSLQNKKMYEGEGGRASRSVATGS
jgi:hypothetical protein